MKNLNTFPHESYTEFLTSPLGPILIKVSELGVLEINLRPNPNWQRQQLSVSLPLSKSSKSKKIFHATWTQLNEYFSKKRKKFDLPLHFQGTTFQNKVWECLQKIPYGEMVSYKNLATMAGCPKGARAVGLANGKNPLPILIPCHRVTQANGKLGGYNGGLEIKKYLLNLENQNKWS